MSASGFAAEPRLAAFSKGTPSSSRFTGTSIFLPLSVRGMSGTAMIASGT